MSEPSVGEVVTRAIADGVARLMRNEAALRTGEGDKVEAVHQARVATRRLRSDLRAFRDALERDEAAELRAELDWLGDLLGAARDADVLAERLAERGRELPTTSAAGVRELTSALAEHRVEARAALSKALREERHTALIERLTEAAQAPPLTGKGDRPASAALPRLVREAWRSLDRRVQSLAQAPSNAELHAVRISAKRCRYTAEACVPVLGRPARQLARAAEALQETLGELSDAVAAELWLREWARRPNSPSRAFAAGELAALERAAAARARSRWPKTWRRVETAAPD
jgi:CHAD domain-containing protein